MAFIYAGDIYVSDHKGGNVKRLTSHPASEYNPHFSPDGKWIAFSAGYEGNQDVYVISVDGGQAKRITWHPGADRVTGWTPDGQHILFTSRREMTSGRSAQLFKVATNKGFPEKVMQAVVEEGSMHEDGNTLAYRPYRSAHGGASGWHNSRGGTTPPIWVMDLAKNTYFEVPHVNATDSNPVWVGDDLYFLSDRDKTRNLYKFAKNKLTQITKFDEWDIMSASSQGNKIAYSMGGELHILDTRRNRTETLSISLNPDLPQLRPQWKNAMSAMTNSDMSTTGKRVVISARGDIYSVPLKDGSTINLTKTPGINERDAMWSPKGDKLVYITDKGGDYALVVSDQFGAVEATHSFGDYKADFLLLQWSPDGSNIIYFDSNMSLWSMDIAKGKRTEIDQNLTMTGFRTSMSQDGDWLAYTKVNTNYFSDLYLYQLSTNQHVKVTDSMSDVNFPAFDRKGKYLFFAASTNRGQTSFGLDMSTQERPRRYGMYAAVLQADGKSPLLPKTADEEATTEDSNSDQVESSDKEDEGKDKKEKTLNIDTDNLANRIVALPIAERAYQNLLVGNDNNLYFIETVQPGVSLEPNGRRLTGGKLKRFNFKDRKVEDVLPGVRGFSLSGDGKKLLMAFSGNALKTADLPKKATGKLKTENLNTKDVRALIDPTKEWAQIFDEVWRNERDYFYDPNMHGLDWKGVYDKYKPLLAHVGRREDLTALIVEMIGEMEVGHNRSWGGDTHREERVSVGLLGANIRRVDGKYVVEKIFTGESWNPFFDAPLAAPGIGINEGDSIKVVNGQALGEDTNFFSVFANTVGKQTRLVVVGKDGEENTVVVEPVASESQLRNWDWVQSNRKKVDELTDGKVGYVYLPNTTTAGYTYFNRMFFAQIDRPAMIIDERRNGGGQAANYITDVLSREYLAGWKYRSGDMILDTPAGAVYGPKVMLIDQDAGSGGDFLPYSFKRMGLGKLIGKRTWGGLIGIFANRPLIDGGNVSVPHFRFFTPEHEWRVENEGVAPDIDVTLDPTLVNRGEDAQLAKGIEEVLTQLKEYKPIRHNKAPAFPKELGK